MQDRYEWIMSTSAEPMPPEEVKRTRANLGLSAKAFAEAIGASHRQHIYRAERKGEKGLLGCQAKLARLLVDAHARK